MINKEGIVTGLTFIVIIFVALSIFNSMEKSDMAKTLEVNETIQQGKEAINIIHNGWIIAGVVSGILSLVGVYLWLRIKLG